MKNAHAQAKYHAHLAHYIPGRLRVRLRRGERRSYVMEHLKYDLLTQPGIDAVDVNHAAGSVTVSYDPHQHSDSSILGLLQDLDVVFGTMLDLPHWEEGTGETGLSTGALSVSGALDDLNRRLANWTGNVIDLRVLFPLSAVGFGLWQIRKHGLMLETLPGWLLVWLGFDAFLKLQVHHGTDERQVRNAAHG